MERVVYKHVYNYILDNSLLYQHQSGFLTGHSTVLQQIEIYHNICQNLDNKMSNVLIFCDISKAFDRVWHRGLISKLRSYGINGNMLKWFKDYISNRTQSVFVNSETSDIGHLSAGVPQGSVLGPLLFLLFINDITDSLGNLARLFADDTSLAYCSNNISTLETRINNDLQIINVWSKDWLVEFNPKKTKALIITNTTQPNINIIFDNEVVEKVENHKHLGVTLSSDGQWTTHINNICESALKQINVLRKFKKYFIT